ncbi:MAG: prepilin-type N-terminal cleavage/methylation domain-containing protein [bacterium]
MNLQVNENSGFSLVELMIALALSSIASVVIITSYITQNRSYQVQEQITGIQQDLRAAIHLMMKEIRMAGYDPLGSAGAKIIEADDTNIQFNFDLNMDGNCYNFEESVRYSLISEGNTQGLYRTISPDDPNKMEAPLVENVENVEFYYTLDDGVKTTTPADPNTIRQVQITLLVKTDIEDRNRTQNTRYITDSGAVWGPYNDGYLRRLLSASARCRNREL